MTLQEAIRSERRFKRKNDKTWYDLTGDRASEFFTKEDLLATDWEVEEAVITLTLSEFNSAFNKAILINNVPQGFMNCEEMRKRLIQQFNLV